MHTADFRSFIDDPLYLVAVANHALSDRHVREPRTSLAIASVPFAVEDKVETFYQMMSGACASLKESGCACWRHSAEGLIIFGFCSKRSRQR